MDGDGVKTRRCPVLALLLLLHGFAHSYTRLCQDNTTSDTTRCCHHISAWKPQSKRSWRSSRSDNVGRKNRKCVPPTCYDAALRSARSEHEAGHARTAYFLSLKERRPDSMTMWSRLQTAGGSSTMKVRATLTGKCRVCYGPRQEYHLL